MKFISYTVWAVESFFASLDMGNKENAAMHTLSFLQISI